MKLEGKAAIVTGGGRGIGREIGRRFAAEGAHVLLADIDGERARDAADEIGAAGGRATPCTADLGLPEGAGHLFRARGRVLRRAPRHPHQQRRHRPSRRLPRAFLRGLGARAPQQPHQRLPLRAGRRADHGGERRRADRQHRLDLGPARQLRAHRLRRHQGGHPPDDAHHGGGARPARHRRQRHRARPHRYRHHQHGAGPGTALPRAHPAGTLRPRPRHRGHGALSQRATRRRT